MLIGEQTLGEDMVLVTHNVKHFIDMPELDIDDWTIPRES